METSFCEASPMTASGNIVLHPAPPSRVANRVHCATTLHVAPKRPCPSCSSGKVVLPRGWRWTLSGGGRGTALLTGWAWVLHLSQHRRAAGLSALAWVQGGDEQPLQTHSPRSCNWEGDPALSFGFGKNTELPAFLLVMIMPANVY